MNACDRRDRAGRAQHVKDAGGMHTRRRRALQFAQAALHFRRHLVIGARLVEASGEHLRQRHDAERHRAPAQDTRHAAGVAEVEPDQFGRTAADVEDERAFVVAVEQGRHAARGEACFLRRRDDVEVQAGFGGDAFDEGGAVCGCAAGLRRDRAGAGYAALAHLHRADADRLDRAGHGGVGEFARLRQAFAEAHGARERVEDAKALRLGLGDQEPAVVRAEIERSVDMARARALRHAVRTIATGGMLTLAITRLRPTRTLRHGANSPSRPVRRLTAAHGPVFQLASNLCAAAAAGKDSRANG